MRRVRGLATEPPGLRAYRAELATAGERPDWDVFRDNQPEAYRALRRALVEAQHGLCAYCEINIAQQAPPAQVEHFRPKSKAEDNHLEYRNMLACCDRSMNPNYEKYPGYFGRPPSQNRSCGATKGDRDPLAPASHVPDPRALPFSPSVVYVERTTGRLRADPEGCAAGQVDPELFEVAINKVLNLNAPSLCLVRKATWDQLARVAELETMTHEDVGDFFWEANLQPADVKLLARFFSTTRTFFGPLAEEWLRTKAIKDLLS